MLRRARLVVVVGLIALTCTFSALAAVEVGQRVDFQGPSIDGRQVNSKNLRGKLVLVEFWATWCEICVAQMPHMVTLKETYGPQGLEIVGVNLDEEREAPKKFIKEAGMTWPNIPDKPQRRLAKQFDVEGTPTLFLIDPNGVLAWKGGTDGLEAAIEEQLKKTPPRLPKKEEAAGAAAPTSAGDAKAKSALSMASAYKSAGRTELARQRYEQVMKEFPGTEFAAEAERELKTLDK